MAQVYNTNKIFTYIQNWYAQVHYTNPIFTHIQNWGARVNHASWRNMLHMEKEGITLQPTYVCDRIFIFLIVAICLLSFISNLFLPLHHQGIDILVSLCAIPSTISWRWSEQPEDWIHPKSTVVLMAAVIFSSTKYVWATSAIIHSNTVTDALTVSTSLSEGWVRDCSLSLYSLKYMKALVDIIAGDSDYEYDIRNLTSSTVFLIFHCRMCFFLFYDQKLFLCGIIVAEVWNSTCVGLLIKCVFILKMVCFLSFLT